MVLTKPMPSMPVSFWKDPDGSRLRDGLLCGLPSALAARRLGPQDTAWIICHLRTQRLDPNRGGVRMGTADFYAVVEGFEEIIDSLVVDTTELGARDEGELLCFVVLAAGATLADVEPQLRLALRNELSPAACAGPVHRRRCDPAHPQWQEMRGAGERILAGVDPDRAVSRDALSNPDSLDPLSEWPAASSTKTVRDSADETSRKFRGHVDSVGRRSAHEVTATQRAPRPTDQGDAMGSIKSGLFISLDGVIESPETWHFPYFNDEMGAVVGELMSRQRRHPARPADLRRVRRLLAERRPERPDHRQP